jgi:hypothetical protein
MYIHALFLFKAPPTKVNPSYKVKSTMIVKYYLIAHLKRGHPSYIATEREAL